jgi:hypothetical protein
MEAPNIHTNTLFLQLLKKQTEVSFVGCAFQPVQWLVVRIQKIPTPVDKDYLD